MTRNLPETERKDGKEFIPIKQADENDGDSFDDITWKIRFPQFLQPRFDAIIKFSFIYICVFVILSIITVGISIATRFDVFYRNLCDESAVVIIVMTILIVARIVFCFFVGSVYPPPPSLALALAIDIFLAIGVVIVAVLQFISFVNIFISHGCCRNIVLSFFQFVWTIMLVIPTVMILSFLLVGLNKVNLHFVGKLYEMFKVEAGRHVTFD